MRVLLRVRLVLRLLLPHFPIASASAAEVAAATEAGTAAEEAAAATAEAVASSQGVRLLRKSLHSNMDVMMQVDTTTQSMVVRTQ